MNKTCASCGRIFEYRETIALALGSDSVCSSKCQMSLHYKNNPIDYEVYELSPKAVIKKTKPNQKDKYVKIELPNGKMIPRYRLVAQLLIGNQLPRGINVHHINKVHTDDRPSNLYLCTWEEHLRYHNGTKEQNEKNAKDLSSNIMLYKNINCNKQRG